MTALPALTLPRVVAVLLATVIAMAGIGRGWAAGAEPAAPVASIAGVAVPICHADGPPGAPDLPGDHACCDQCVLGAAVILATPPAVGGPASPVTTLRRADGIRPSVRAARLRTPRQAQAPPTAG